MVWRVWRVFVCVSFWLVLSVALLKEWAWLYWESWIVSFWKTKARKGKVGGNASLCSFGGFISFLFWVFQEPISWVVSFGFSEAMDTFWFWRFPNFSLSFSMKNYPLRVCLMPEQTHAPYYEPGLKGTSVEGRCSMHVCYANDSYLHLSLFILLAELRWIWTLDVFL